MRKILVIDNEPLGANGGLIADAADFGFAVPLYNVKRLSETLSAYGAVTVCHYQQMQALSDDYDAIFLSGRFADWNRDTVAADFADEIKLILETKAPVWGVCAGEQIIGLAFGARIIASSMGELGYTKQTLKADHPMLKGLPSLTVFEHHFEQVSPLPEDFDLLTSTEICPVQMLVHRTRPIVATQFHPELGSAEYPDGKKLLDNFFALYC